MFFKERRGQILRLLPAELRKDLFKAMHEFTDLGQIKEWIRVQVELEQEWAEEDKTQRAGRRPIHLAEPHESEDEEDEILALFPNASPEQILALQQRGFRGGGRGRPGGSRTYPPRRTGPPPGGERPGPSRPPSRLPPRLPGAQRADEGRCVNCGATDHLAKLCPKAAVDKHKRPCFRCGEEGHFAANCTAGKAQPAKLAEAPSERISFNVMELSEEAWEVVRRGARPRQPTAVTLGDFLHSNVFSKLAVDELEGILREWWAS